MREVLSWSVFILLIIGTFGLIFNEFIFGWGVILLVIVVALIFHFLPDKELEKSEA